MAQGIRIGYGRVSSRDQSLDVQRQQLEQAGCHKIRLETKSGTTMKRPELQEIMRWIGEGDTLVICKLDRLARSIADLHTIVQALRERGAQLEVLDQPMDLDSFTGKILFCVLGMMAELENSLRKERQMAGIHAAQAQGKRFGRTKALSPAQVAALHAERQAGSTPRELMARYGIAKTALYRYLKHGAAQAQPEAAD